MTYRKVYFDRDADQPLNLQRFVELVLGKRYGLTPSKLVRDQSVSFDERGNPQDLQHGHGRGLRRARTLCAPSYHGEETVRSLCSKL